MFSQLIKLLLTNRIFWYLGSRYLVMAIQFFASIFIAVKLGSYHFGIWSFIILLISIGSIFNWGIGNAITIFYVQNKEDRELCNKYIFNSVLLVFITFIPPLLILGYDRIIGIHIFEKYHIGNLIYAIIATIMLQYLCSFFTNIFRVKNKLIEIVIQQSFWPICMFLLIFCASGETLLYCLTYSYTASSLLVVVMFICRRQIPWGGTADVGIMKKIAAKGFYLFMYNVCFMLIVFTTKFQISNFYSVEEFGYFAFAFTLAQGIMLLLDSVIFLMFPKMIDMLKGSDTQQIIAGITLLRKNYILPLHLLFYTVLAASPIFFYFLPQYSKSFKPFVLILCTLIMYSHCFGYNSYLLAQNKEREFSCIALGALLLNNLLVYIFCITKCRFEYAILGTLITYIIYSFAVNCYAMYCLSEHSIKNYFVQNLPASLLLYMFTLFLTLTDSSAGKFFVITLILFIAFNIKRLKELCENVLTLIHNDKIMNV